MVNALGSSNINPIQMFSAINAFKSTERVMDNPIQDVSEGININDSSVLDNQNLEEIKQMAKVVGEETLSNEDITYGLTYGRSVIADYVI